ncbi:MAG: serine/threonine-protein kinase [Deltaproteobacteria bacterium]|nr:serine/threonine-protein kinase [Deltaproteobacteria bacterium]
MVDCPRCRTSYEGNVTFCGVCGTRLPGACPAIAPPADPLVGLVIDGRYRIIDLVGRGGMGAVYRAEHVKMGKIMAVKLLHGELSQDQDLVRRFRREAETVSRLTHINTVSVFDFGTHNGMMFLVMEFIDGRDLAEILRASGPIPFARAAGILIQVCSALVEAHGKGIVHRDLKPENIIVSTDPDQGDFVKVLDFGLAKLKNVRGGTYITVQGSLLGTPYYMAPEHIRGEGVDARTDVYALGAMMHKLLTDEPPFTAGTPMGIITKHLTEEPPAPSERFPELGIPRVADRIVRKAMAKSPADRYASADEMRRALADALDGMSTPGGRLRLSSSASTGPGPSSGKAADGTWQMGKVEVPPTGGWDMGALGATVLAGEAAASVPPSFARGSSASSLGRSVIIGAREVGIGTRSDFFSFERRIKKRKIFTIALLAAVGAAGVVAAAAFLLASREAPPDPGRETEPNDAPGKADPLWPDVPLTAFISGELPKGDVDWYRLRGPTAGKWAVEVAVTGAPGLDLGARLGDPASPTPLAEANRNGPGGGERIGPLVVDVPELLLMVQEVQPAGASAGDFPSAPYTVTFTPLEAASVENEPNDTPDKATIARPGTTMAGALATLSDVDWYCLPADAAASQARVSGVPGLDVGLALRSAPGAAESAPSSAGEGRGAAVALPAGTGPVCVAVRLASPPPQDRGVSLDAPYRISFQ